MNNHFYVWRAKEGRKISSYNDDGDGKIKMGIESDYEEEKGEE